MQSNRRHHQHIVKKEEKKVNQPAETSREHCFNIGCKCSCIAPLKCKRFYFQKPQAIFVLMLKAEVRKTFRINCIYCFS